MPETSGVVLAQELRNYGYNGFIVFLSASKDYGPESYQVKAFNYLVKPISIADIRAILKELHEAATATDTASIHIKTTSFTKRVLLKEISHIEVKTNYVYFSLEDGSELKSRVALSEIESHLLEDPRFVKCHRSFVVNLSNVDNLKSNEFVMRNGARIPISRGKSDVKRIYHSSTEDKKRGGG